MTNRSLNLDNSLYQYLLDHSVRETDLMRELRAVTAQQEMSRMQIAPEQGQFMALLVELMRAERIIEIGTFTGYSALCMAQAMPEHGHGGSELTLVLSGSYHDKYGHFGRGDVADLDDDAEHQPIVDDGEDCICLVAVERPTRFKGLLPKVFQPFVGI